MRNFLQGIRQGFLVYFRVIFSLITFPFRLIFYILYAPFRGMQKFNQFLNDVPQENPVGEILVGITTDKTIREELWREVKDLRTHLLRAVSVLALAIMATFWVAQDLMNFLSKPVGGLANLQAIQVTEEIGVFMRVAMTAGLALVFPYIAFEFWLFVAPGLRPREKKMGLIGIPFATILFLMGMAFTYYVLLPAALPFLGGFTEISQVWSAKEYFTFVTGLMIWIGVFFEFPLIIYILTAIGLIKPQVLAEQWRIAIVIIAILAAAVTPTVDPVNMGLVMIPMTLLYFISIGLSYLAYAGRGRNVEVTENVQGEGAG